MNFKTIIKYTFIALVAFLFKMLANYVISLSGEQKTIVGEVDVAEEPIKDGIFPSSGIVDGYEYVDLGLSVKWATCNVGAEFPWFYGDYYAWGDIERKDTYTEYNCFSHNLPYYVLENDGVTDNQGNLKDVYDPASQSRGENWRMPSVKEMTELIDSCKWRWNKMNEIEGYKVTGKNGNWIFLPAAGYRYGTSSLRVGSYGYYWGSTVGESDSNYAYYLYFSSSSKSTSSNNRYYGRSVRPVTE